MLKDDDIIINIIEGFSSRLLQLKANELNKLKELELSANHFQYISILDKLGKATLTEIAEKLQISKPAVTAFISKLLKQEIILKTQSDKDRRSYFIKLSKKGKQISDIYKKALLTFTNELKNSMSKEDFKQLIKILEKIYYS